MEDRSISPQPIPPPVSPRLLQEAPSPELAVSPPFPAPGCPGGPGCQPLGPPLGSTKVQVAATTGAALFKRISELREKLANVTFDVAGESFREAAAEDMEYQQFDERLQQQLISSLKSSDAQDMAEEVEEAQTSMVLERSLFTTSNAWSDGGSLQQLPIGPPGRRGNKSSGVDVGDEPSSEANEGFGTDTSWLAEPIVRPDTRVKGDEDRAPAVGHAAQAAAMVAEAFASPGGHPKTKERVDHRVGSLGTINEIPGSETTDAMDQGDGSFDGSLDEAADKQSSGGQSTGSGALAASSEQVPADVLTIDGHSVAQTVVDACSAFFGTLNNDMLSLQKRVTALERDLLSNSVRLGSCELRLDGVLRSMAKVGNNSPDLTLTPPTTTGNVSVPSSTRCLPPTETTSETGSSDGQGVGAPVSKLRAWVAGVDSQLSDVRSAVAMAMSSWEEICAGLQTGLDDLRSQKARDLQGMKDLVASVETQVQLLRDECREQAQRSREEFREELEAAANDMRRALAGSANQFGAQVAVSVGGADGGQASAGNKSAINAGRQTTGSPRQRHAQSADAAGGLAPDAAGGLASAERSRHEILRPSLSEHTLRVVHGGARGRSAEVPVAATPSGDQPLPAPTAAALGCAGQGTVMRRANSADSGLRPESQGSSATGATPSARPHYIPSPQPSTARTASPSCLVDSRGPMAEGESGSFVFRSQQQPAPGNSQHSITSGVNGGRLAGPLHVMGPPREGTRGGSAGLPHATSLGCGSHAFNPARFKGRSAGCPPGKPAGAPALAQDGSSSSLAAPAPTPAPTPPAPPASLQTHPHASLGSTPASSPPLAAGQAAPPPSSAQQPPGGGVPTIPMTSPLPSPARSLLVTRHPSPTPCPVSLMIAGQRHMSPSYMSPVPRRVSPPHAAQVQPGPSTGAPTCGSPTAHVRAWGSPAPLASPPSTPLNCSANAPPGPPAAIALSGHMVGAGRHTSPPGRLSLSPPRGSFGVPGATAAGPSAPQLCIGAAVGSMNMPPQRMEDAERWACNVANRS